MQQSQMHIYDFWYLGPECLLPPNKPSAQMFIPVLYPPYPYRCLLSALLNVQLSNML
jgi:hypothetical protein